MIPRIFIASFIWTFAIASTARAADEHPDALYQQGRFEEADKAYAEADMDHPKDIRFRYNRGCAAYQKADFDGAMASFASVLKRADSDETRFKATFNLGNSAFKKGDFFSAAAYFKQALALKSDSEDARVNLELTLREIEKNKEAEKARQKEQSENESSKDASQENHDGKDQGEKNEGDSPRQDKSKKESPEQKTTSDDQSGQPQEEPRKQDETSSSHQDEGSDDPRRSTEPGRQDTAQEPGRDLSGSLEPMKSLLPAQGEESKEKTGRQLDQRKADAFLDNVKENRSRFLQYQMGKEQGRGAASGKDW